MRELQAGLWHWQAPHPDWTPGEPWRQEVSSYAIDDGARLFLFDPLAVPTGILEFENELRSAGAPRPSRIKGIVHCLLVAVAATTVPGVLAANALASGANVNVGPGPVGICHDTGNSQAPE